MTELRAAEFVCSAAFFFFFFLSLLLFALSLVNATQRNLVQSLSLTHAPEGVHFGVINVTGSVTGMRYISRERRGGGSTAQDGRGILRLKI